MNRKLALIVSPAGGCPANKSLSSCVSDIFKCTEVQQCINATGYYYDVLTQLYMEHHFRQFKDNQECVYRVYLIL